LVLDRLVPFVCGTNVRKSNHDDVIPFAITSLSAKNHTCMEALQGFTNTLGV